MDERFKKLQIENTFLREGLSTMQLYIEEAEATIKTMNLHLKLLLDYLDVMPNPDSEENDNG